MVANSASVSTAAASGGVTVAPEAATRSPTAHRRVVAEFGGVGISRTLDVREPVARFGVDVDFVKRMAFDFAGVNAEDQMAVRRLHVELQLLLARQVPVRVKPVRIARGQKKFFRAVGFGQFGLRRFKLLRGRRRDPARISARDRWRAAARAGRLRARWAAPRSLCADYKCGEQRGRRPPRFWVRIWRSGAGARCAWPFSFALSSFS